MVLSFLKSWALCLGLVVGSLIEKNLNPSTSPVSEMEPQSCRAPCVPPLDFFLHCLAKCPIVPHFRHFFEKAGHFFFQTSNDDSWPCPDCPHVHIAWHGVRLLSLLHLVLAQLVQGPGPAQKLPGLATHILGNMNSVILLRVRSCSMAASTRTRSCISVSAIPFTMT